MALVEYKKDLSTSLRRDVFPFYQPPKDSDLAMRNPKSETWARLQGDMERRELVAKLQFWADHFQISEEWLLDCVVQTLAHNFWLKHDGFDTRNWTINLPLYDDIYFSPKLVANGWIPPSGGGSQSWDDFKSSMLKQFHKELNRFRTESYTRFGALKADLRTDAKWTVMYKYGKLALEIAALEHSSLKRYSDPEQVVYRRIKRFAQENSVTLPTRRRHRVVQRS